MSRLVVVSNRVAQPQEAQAGGLVTAMQAALAERGGIWFGWNGEITARSNGLQREQRDNVLYATFDLNQPDYDEFYAGFSNRVLWPLFHYRPDLVDFHREAYAGYQRVNARFAALLVPLIKAGDLIWVHDYHLIPLAAELRRLGVANRIGFFLHTPLPAAELLRTLPCHRELMESFQAYDVVGMQTEPDLHALHEYYVQELDARVRNDWVRLPNGRRFDSGAFPISIDTDTIARQARRSAGLPAMDRLRESVGDRALMVGVDRLDYSKGLPARFEAFGLLLEHNRYLHGRVTMLQIAPPTRTQVPEYRKIRAELEQMTGHINGLYAAPDWIPIRYVNRAIPQALLAGYYRGAQVGLVTPLRDGMNLVAKEYVAAQDPENPGVLVLSRFAGAALEMESALQVNPFDQEEVAEAMARALNMSRAERRVRWQLMMEQLRHNDVTNWREAFLDRLAERKLLTMQSGRSA